MKLLSPNGWTGRQLATLPVLEFHAAVDQLEGDSVPRSYYEQVVGRQPGRFAR